MQNCRIALVLLLLGGTALSAFAVSNLTVTPAIVQEDYFDTLAVEFDLAPSRQEALVEMRVDFNQDGQADGEDFAIESFVVRDNEQFTIQGTVYPGVPGDSEPATGKVRIVLSQADERFFLGQYVIRVDDGAGAQQQGLEFRQEATSMQITGSVTLDHGAKQSALVMIEDDSEDGEFDIIIPAYGGDFSAYLPRESTYLVVALMPGKVTLTEEGGGALVHRSPGDTDPVVLNVSSSDRQISGRVVNEQSQPVPYVLVLGQWSEPEGEDEPLLGLSVAKANENGEYSLAVTEGNWTITAVQTASQGYAESDSIGLEDIAVGPSNVTAPDLVLPTRVTSLITGRLVRQGSGQPVSGLLVEAFIPGEETFSVAGTDDDGRFVLGVFENTWTVEIIETPRLVELQLIRPLPQSFSVGQGQVLDLGDIELGVPEAQIHIQVVDDGNQPLEGIGLYVNLHGSWEPEDHYWVETEADGRVTFLVPQVGSYLIGAGYQRYVAPGEEDYERYKDYKFLVSPSGVQVDIAAGEVESVSFTMTYGGLIEGYLRGGGHSVEIGEVRVYPKDVASLFDVQESKWLYPLDARPTGIDYWIPLPPGEYRVHANNVRDNQSDPFGYAPQFAHGKYDLRLADLITVPGVRQKARVDFDLVRGGKIRGEVFVNLSGGGQETAGGVRVEALDPVTLQRIGGTETAWSGDVGNYQLWLPADDYLLRARPALGTWIFEPVYYEEAADPEQAVVLYLNEFDDVSSLNIYATSIGPRTLGDIDRNGRVEPLDLFSLSTVWQAEVDTNVTSLLANEDDSDTIDAVDLLLWLDRFRRFNY